MQRNSSTQTCCWVDVSSKPCCNLYACSVTTLWGDWFLSNNCSIWNNALNVNSNSINKPNDMQSKFCDAIWIFGYHIVFHSTYLPKNCFSYLWINAKPRHEHLLHCEHIYSRTSSKKSRGNIWNHFGNPQGNVTEGDNLALTFLRCCSVCGLSDCAASCRGIGMDSSVWLLQETEPALNVTNSINSTIYIRTITRHKMSQEK